MKTQLSIVLFFMVLLSACKLRYSFNGGSVPAEAETFSVEYIEVRAGLADPSYGQRLTESLKDLLLDQTPLSLTGSDGDLHFAGEVTRYEVIPVAANADEISSRNRLNVELKVSYFNTIEPEKNKDFTVRQFEDFESDLEFSDVEESLLESIDAKLLQDIYDKTLGDW